MTSVNQVNYKIKFLFKSDTLQQSMVLAYFHALSQNYDQWDLNKIISITKTHSLLFTVPLYLTQFSLLCLLDICYVRNEVATPVFFGLVLT
jgi:hypothetical protein